MADEYDIDHETAGAIFIEAIKVLTDIETSDIETIVEDVPHEILATTIASKVLEVLELNEAVVIFHGDEKYLVVKEGRDDSIAIAIYTNPAFIIENDLQHGQLAWMHSSENATQEQIDLANRIIAAENRELTKEEEEIIFGEKVTYH